MHMAFSAQCFSGGIHKKLLFLHVLHKLTYILAPHALHYLVQNLFFHPPELSFTMGPTYITSYNHYDCEDVETVRLVLLTDDFFQM